LMTLFVNNIYRPTNMLICKSIPCKEGLHICFDPLVGPRARLSYIHRWSDLDENDLHTSGRLLEEAVDT
jgi:hypothetical protein